MLPPQTRLHAMDDIVHVISRNAILRAISPETLARLRPHLGRRALVPHETLISPHEPIAELLFPESGMISIVSSDETMIEIGVVGREGVAGLPALLCVDGGPLKAVCQLPGTATTIPVASFMAVAAGSPDLSRTMLRYIHVFAIQIANTAFANARHSVEQRLARWLLMCADRSDGDELPITHDFLATMLGVRRPGVTVATHVLEGHGLIRARRGRIVIVDREGLKAHTGGSYGLAEAEYARVMRPGFSEGRAEPALQLA